MCRFLRGDYCLESDLRNYTPKKAITTNLSYVSEMIKFDEDSEIASSIVSIYLFFLIKLLRVFVLIGAYFYYLLTVESIGSEDEQEIRRYLKYVKKLLFKKLYYFLKK